MASASTRRRRRILSSTCSVSRSSLLVSPAKGAWRPASRLAAREGAVWADPGEARGDGDADDPGGGEESGSCACPSGRPLPGAAAGPTARAAVSSSQKLYMAWELAMEGTSVSRHSHCSSSQRRRSTSSLCRLTPSSECLGGGSRPVTVPAPTSSWSCTSVCSNGKSLGASVHFVALFLVHYFQGRIM